MMSLRTNQRLVSLDVFRGLAIICMILVNGLPNFEQAYPLLLHSSWEGLTLADLAFPGFVFAMGAAGALWFPRHLRDHAAKKFYLIFKRSLLLCLLGLVLNQLPLIFQYLLTPDALTGTLGQQIIEHGRALFLRHRRHQPHHHEEGHHRGDEVRVGHLPRAAMMTTVAFLIGSTSPWLLGHC